MKVVVTGSSGQLGTDVVKALVEAGDECLAATRSDADLRDHEALRRFVLDQRPDVLVNCAALHDVAACEADPGLAIAVNAEAVETLAAATRDVGAAFMTVSTDYVFDGVKEGGYTEDDAPSPLNQYGASKLEGEERALSTNERSFVVRTQSLFGHTQPAGKGPNFVELMLKLAAERSELEVDQFRMGPTSTAELASNMSRLLRSGRYGLYHMSCEGEASWYEFAVKILELSGSATKVTPVGNDHYATPFVRPERTYLVNQRLRVAGLDQMPGWEQALADYLHSRPSS